ncbi:MAG: hypothetical protein ACLFMU_02840 [Bacteroidales bacterium]
MKQNLIWLLALAAMALSSTLHAQRALPDSIMFEGINLDNTCYDEIVATFGEPDEYHMSPGDSPIDGDREEFTYHFPGPDAFLGRGQLYIVIVGGTITDFSVMGSEYKLFTDINGGVGPGDPIGWFAQNNFTLSPPETTTYPGVNLRQIIFQPDIDYITFRVQETNGIIVDIYITTL